jgi:hypothetical protein
MRAQQIWIIGKTGSHGSKSANASRSKIFIAFARLDTQYWKPEAQFEK